MYVAVGGFCECEKEAHERVCTHKHDGMCASAFVAHSSDHTTLVESHIYVESARCVMVAGTGVGFVRSYIQFHSKYALR